MRQTSDRNETEVSPAGAVLTADGDVGQFTIVLLMSDVTVDNGDTATTGGYCSKVLFSTLLVPIHKAHTRVLRLSLYHPLHIQGRPGPVVKKHISSRR